MYTRECRRIHLWVIFPSVQLTVSANLEPTDRRLEEPPSWDLCTGVRRWRSVNSSCKRKQLMPACRNWESWDWSNSETWVYKTNIKFTTSAPRIVLSPPSAIPFIRLHTSWWSRVYLKHRSTICIIYSVDCWAQLGVYTVQPLWLFLYTSWICKLAHVSSWFKLEFQPRS